jgi:opacity protein-like surface antigen
MRTLRTFAAAAVLIAGVSSTALAQRNWGGQFYLGYPIAVSSNLSNYATGSFSWGGGAVYSPEDKPWGVRFDIRTSRFNGKNDVIRDSIAAHPGPGGEIGSYNNDYYARTWDFALAGELGSPKANKTRVYALGGVNFSNKYSAATEPQAVSGCYWDPWWGYVCGSGVADAIIADRSEWEFGFNVGGGVSMDVGRGARLFLEAVYTSIGGSTVTSGGTTQKSKSVGYVPIYFGVRF